MSDEGESVSTVGRADFDHHSPALADDWVGVWREMQDTCPVTRSELYGGFWVLSKYDDVARAARDDYTFSSFNDIEHGGAGGQGIIIPPNPMRSGMIELDPPEYQKHRKVVAPWFSPAGVEKLRPAIESYTAAALDLVIERGEFDIVLDFANPIPAAVTLVLIGIDVDEWQRYGDAFHEMVYQERGTPEYDTVLGKLGWVHEQLFKIVHDRRKAPADDLISELIAADLGDGERLSDQDVVDTLFLFLGGGLDTTTALSADALVWLDEHPEAKRQLIERPELMPLACEEFLRYFTPTQALSRTVAKDCTFAGREFKKSDRVLLSWAAANVDPDMFDRPEEVVLDRFPNRHAAFGLGGHRCLGSNLARAEFTTMVSQVLARMPDYTVDKDKVQKYPRIGIVNGYISVPARFTPSSRVGVDNEILTQMMRKAD